jgi:hypothetical protein
LSSARLRRLWLGGLRGNGVLPEALHLHRNPFLRFATQTFDLASDASIDLCLNV